MRAKRALGEHYACVRFSTDARRRLRLIVTTPTAVPAARSLARRAGLASRTSVGVSAPRYSFAAIEAIKATLIAESPGGPISIRRANPFDWTTAGTDACPPIRIETNGVRTWPQDQPMPPIPDEWLTSPQYRWAVQQPGIYGYDRVEAYPEMFVQLR